MFGIGGFEVLLIFLVVLLLFGSKQLPEFARTLGKTWKTIKTTTEEVRNEFEKQADILDKENKNLTSKPIKKDKI